MGRISTIALATLALLATATLAPQRAVAALVYEAEAPAFTLAVGESRTVTIYLKETGTNQVASDGGLFGAGFAVDRDAAATAAKVGLPVIAPAFDPAGSVDQPDRAGAAGNRLSSSATTGPVPGAGGLLPLGTVTLTGLSAGSATFNLVDFSAATDDLITYGASILDPAMGPGSFVVTVAVPEPGFTALLCVLGVAGLRHRMRTLRR